MKVVAINGSPRKNGNTTTALEVMKKELEQDGIDVEIIQVGDEKIHGCIACNYCRTSEHSTCVFKDDMVNEVAEKMRRADGFILASPTYYAGIAGTMKCFLDRVFYSSSNYFRYKVATGIVVVRRTGGIDVLHQLTNFLDLAETVTPPSQYWPVVHGTDKKEILQDVEGIQTIQKNARAMAWLLKLIEAGKGTINPPEYEEKRYMNFIR